jgi:hypothetical protein
VFRFLLRLSAGDRGQHPDLLAALEARVEAVALARVHAVDVDVHERPQRAALVEHQVRNGECPERFGDRGRLRLEPAATARLRREERGQQDYGQSPTSTERIGGRFLAASVQVPPCERIHTEPPCVPT